MSTGLTDSQSAILKKWADIVNERSAIEEFLNWAESTGKAQFRFVMSRSDILDEYYEIDAKELDEARRALLKKARNIYSQVNGEET